MRAFSRFAFQSLLMLCAACPTVGGDRKDLPKYAAADFASIECKPLVGYAEPIPRETSSQQCREPDPVYGEAARFRIAKVEKSTDGIGYPAIAIEVDASDEARLVEWSKAQDNGSVGFFFEGELITTLIVEPITTPKLVMCGWPKPWTKDEVSRLVGRMRSSH